MSPLKGSVTVVQRQLAGAQLALIPVEEECDEYCRRLGAEEQRRCSLDALLRSVCGHLVDHVSLGDLVRGSLLRIWTTILTFICRRSLLQ